MLNRYSTDWGLLIIRLVLGAAFIMHGYPKIAGGPEMWTSIGLTMKTLHIDFAPVFWGLMASLAEFAGGVCLVLGFLFRPALALMIFTMFVAAFSTYAGGGGYNDYSHAAEDGIIFLGLFIAGPGKYALKIVRR